MKQMNKEELINYFIELLGDNHVLGKYLSIEEIRERLNENIKAVKYMPLEGNTIGSYDRNKNIVMFDIYKETTEETMKAAIVHELVHALSYSKSEDKNIVTHKTGFTIKQVNKNGRFEKDEDWFYSPDESFREFGRGLDEGMVQLLTNEILGIDNTDLDKGYEEEKDFTRLYLSIFNKEKLKEKFFSKIDKGSEIKEPIKYIFGEELEKYPMLTNKFVLALKKSEILTVKKANSHGKLNEEDKEYYDTLKGSVCNDIKELIELYLIYSNKDKNLQSKVEQILEALSKFHDTRLNYKYGDLILGLSTPELSEAVYNVVFDKNNDLELGKKINAYIRLTKNDSTADKWKRCKNSIENYCIKKGIVDEADFSKSGMLLSIFKSYFDTTHNFSIKDKDLRNILSNFSYKKVGSHYELLYQGVDETINCITHSTWFDGDGKISKGYEISFAKNGWSISDFSMISEADRAKAENLRIQIQKISEKSDKQFINAIVFGNDVIMNYKDKTKSINRIVYTLDNTENLVLVQEEKSRRLTDDLEEEKIDRGISRYINTLRERSRADIVLRDILFKFSRSKRDMTIDELREILIISKNELNIKINFSEVVDKILLSNLDMTQEEKIRTILSIARDLKLEDKVDLDTINYRLKINAEQWKELNGNGEIEFSNIEVKPEVFRNENIKSEINKGKNNFQNSEIWMNRFKNWYGFIDRMIKNIETNELATKLINIKSDIVGAISSIFKKRNNVQTEEEERKDDKGR